MQVVYTYALLRHGTPSVIIIFLLPTAIFSPVRQYYFSRDDNCMQMRQTVCVCAYNYYTVLWHCYTERESKCIIMIIVIIYYMVSVNFCRPAFGQPCLDVYCVCVFYADVKLWKKYKRGTVFVRGRDPQVCSVHTHRLVLVRPEAALDLKFRMDTILFTRKL